MLKKLIFSKQKLVEVYNNECLNISIHAFIQDWNSKCTHLLHRIMSKDYRKRNSTVCNMDTKTRGNGPHHSSERQFLVISSSSNTIIATLESKTMENISLIQW